MLLHYYSPTAIQSSTLPSLSTFSLYPSSLSSSTASLSSLSISYPFSLQHLSPLNLHGHGHAHFNISPKPKGLKLVCSQSEPLKVMISGAPASGKGTQCEMIVQQMVTGRLSQKDAKEKGWLLDGYPRSFDQAQSLEKLKIIPDVYISLDVPDEILIDRCVGRRLDPVTGKIYHIKNLPPQTEEIKARLVTRPDDTEEKVKSRLQIYKQNVEAILSTYEDILKKIDGNRPKEVIFEEIYSLMSQESWRGIPTRLNNIPHSREIREYFYDDVLQATQRAINDGKTRLKVEINIPELNPEMDVYRIGTLMELVRALSLSFADDGKRIKVCVQGSMGEGALAGMPLQLAGTRKILEYMDWGEYGAKGNFINLGSIGGKEVEEQDDIFILVAPQNAVGNCIIDDLRAMTDAAGSRPVILINPRLKDLPASSGIMQGNESINFPYKVLKCWLVSSFVLCPFAFKASSSLSAKPKIWMSYPYRYEVYKRVNDSTGKEKYTILSTFSKRPDVDEINDAFEGRTRDQAKKASGFWGFLSGIL
ncbi:hypothetical protein LguiA_011148 [Lonicera macranthoides]